MLGLRDFEKGEVKKREVMSHSHSNQFGTVLRKLSRQAENPPNSVPNVSNKFM